MNVLGEGSYLEARPRKTFLDTKIKDEFCLDERFSWNNYLYYNLTQMRLLNSTPKEEKTPDLIVIQLRPDRLNKLNALI